jgi:hypothetical protein
MVAPGFLVFSVDCRSSQGDLGSSADQLAGQVQDVVMEG